jgi:hypothetical protein
MDALKLRMWAKAHWQLHTLLQELVTTFARFQELLFRNFF